MLKNYEIKDDFHDIIIKLEHELEIKLSLKIRNIIAKNEFKYRMSIFSSNNKNSISSERKSNIISTGINMNDRLKLFNKIDYNSSLTKRNTEILEKKLPLKETNSEIIDNNETFEKEKEKKVKKNSPETNKKDNFEKKEKEISKSLK